MPFCGVGHVLKVICAASILVAIQARGRKSLWTDWRGLIFSNRSEWTIETLLPALKKNGCFMLENFFSGEEIEGLTDDLDKQIAMFNSTQRWRFIRLLDWEKGRFDLPQPRTGMFMAKGLLQKWVSVIGRTIERYLKRPRANSWPILVEHSTIVSAQGAEAQPFHSDHSFPETFVTCQTYLTDTTWDMGTLEVQPTSHAIGQNGFKTMEEWDKFETEQVLQEQKKWYRAGKRTEAEAISREHRFTPSKGSLVCYDAGIQHRGTDALASGVRRHLIYATFAATDPDVFLIEDWEKARNDPNYALNSQSSALFIHPSMRNAFEIRKGQLVRMKRKPGPLTPDLIDWPGWWPACLPDGDAKFDLPEDEALCMIPMSECDEKNFDLPGGYTGEHYKFGKGSSKAEL